MLRGGALTIAWLVVPLAVVEGVVRLVALAPPAAPNPNIWQPHETLGWAHAPGSGGAFHSPYGEYVAEVRINSLGLRGRPASHDKPPGIVRVLSLADSFGEAVEVDLDATYDSRLEASLSASLRRPVEVLNAAVGGWGTDQELTYYLNEGYRYDPDVVLLAFFPGNDLVNNYAPLQLAETWGGVRKPFYALSPDGELTGPAEVRPPDATGPRRPEPWLNGVGAWLWRHAATYRLTVPHLRDVPWLLRTLGPTGLLGGDGIVRAGFPAIPTVYLSYQAPPDDRFEAAWRLTEALLGRLREETERRGARLAVVVICAREQVYPELWAETLETYPAMKALQWDLEWQNRRLSSFLDSAGIPHVDLLPIFRRTAADRADHGPLYFPRDGHWTPRGHRVAAEALHSLLLPLLRRDDRTAAAARSPQDPAPGTRACTKHDPPSRRTSGVRSRVRFTAQANRNARAEIAGCMKS